MQPKHARKIVKWYQSRLRLLRPSQLWNMKREKTPTELAFCTCINDCELLEILFRAKCTQTTTRKCCRISASLLDAFIHPLSYRFAIIHSWTVHSSQVQLRTLAHKFMVDIVKAWDVGTGCCQCVLARKNCHAICRRGKNFATAVCIITMKPVKDAWWRRGWWRRCRILYSNSRHIHASTSCGRNETFHPFFASIATCVWGCQQSRAVILHCGTFCSGCCVFYTRNLYTVVSVLSSLSIYFHSFDRRTRLRPRRGEKLDVVRAQARTFYIKNMTSEYWIYVEKDYRYQPRTEWKKGISYY